MRHPIHGASAELRGVARVWDQSDGREERTNDFESKDNIKNLSEMGIRALLAF